MSMPVILRSRRAMGDLEEIWNYIACDSDSRADRWLERIDKVFHDGIRIVRILHGARQIPRLFGRG